MTEPKAMSEERLEELEVIVSEASDETPALVYELEEACNEIHRLLAEVGRLKALDDKRSFLLRRMTERWE